MQIKHCQPILGLTKYCQPITGFKSLTCKLFLGRNSVVHSLDFPACRLPAVGGAGRFAYFTRSLLRPKKCS